MLLLRRANISSLSGSWDDNDLDVLDGIDGDKLGLR